MALLSKVLATWQLFGLVLILRRNKLRLHLIFLLFWTVESERGGGGGGVMKHMLKKDVLQFCYD